MAEKENLLVNLNDITEKEASWLVPQRMPKGQIIILAGDGGSGKTNAWCALAAAISSGKQVFFDETPKEFFQAEPQRVLFFSSEDSLEYTLKARLRKAGANFNNIFSVDLKNERFSEIKFNSELLKSLIEDVKPTLVVFDPLQAFVPVDMQMGQRNAMRACLSEIITDQQEEIEQLKAKLKETEELCDLYYSQKSVSTLQLDIINFVSRIYSKETLSFLYGAAKTAYEYELKQEDEN